MPLNYLAIQNEGTWAVESLSSFVHRQAEAQHVAVNAFIRAAIGDETASHRRYMASRNVEAGNDRGEQWLSRLETLTQRSGLDCMTFKRFREIVDIDLDVHAYRTFCPFCLEESADEPGGCFIPLIWRLKSYRSCIKHRRSMTRICPHCACSTLRIFAAGGRNGCCTKCGRWMGLKVGDDRAGSCIVNDDELHLSLCAAELMAVCQSDEVAWTNARTFVPQLISEQFPGRRTRRFKRGLGATLNRATYKGREFRLNLMEWRALSHVTDTSLLHTLQARPIPDIKSHTWFSDTSRTAANGRRPSFGAVVLRVLEKARDAAVPVSVQSCMLEAGFASAYNAYIHHPDLARLVARRFSEYQKSARELRKLSLEAAVIAAMSQLKEAGEPVSCRRVGEIINHEGSIGELQKAYTEVCRSFRE